MRLLIERFEKTVTGICYIETEHSKFKRKEINMINTYLTIQMK